MGHEKGHLLPDRVACRTRLTGRLRIGYDNLSQGDDFARRHDEVKFLAPARRSRFLSMIFSGVIEGKGEDVGVFVQSSIASVQVSDGIVVGYDQSYLTPRGGGAPSRGLRRAASQGGAIRFDGQRALGYALEPPLGERAGELLEHLDRY